MIYKPSPRPTWAGMGLHRDPHKAECMLSVLVSTPHCLVAAKGSRHRALLLFVVGLRLQTATSRPAPDVNRASRKRDAYPAMAGGRPTGWEKLFKRTGWPPPRIVKTTASATPPGRPLNPQRSYVPRGHLRRPAREKAPVALADLPQGDRRQAGGQARDRDLGRRRAEPARSCIIRRLHRRHDIRLAQSDIIEPLNIGPATSWSASTGWVDIVEKDRRAVRLKRSYKARCGPKGVRGRKQATTT